MAVIIHVFGKNLTNGLQDDFYICKILKNWKGIGKLLLKWLNMIMGDVY